jgi:hypothetical protein
MSIIHLIQPKFSSLKHLFKTAQNIRLLSNNDLGLNKKLI